MGDLGVRIRDDFRLVGEMADRRNNPAGYLRERLMRRVSDFETRLGVDEELGARLASSGHHEPFRLAEIGHSDPDLIIFRGETEEGRPVEVIQHHSQVSLMLVAVAKAPGHSEPRRIGFLSAGTDEAP